MDLLKDNIGRLYARFLLTSFGSTLISSIYGLVDAAMVGRYHGPDGSAAMAVVSPMWNIIYSLGLLAAIGGSGSTQWRADAAKPPPTAILPPPSQWRA